MKVSVDRNLCESHGVCEATVPDVFELGDDDVMRIKQEEPPAAEHEAVRLAVRSCPRQALSITE